MKTPLESWLDRVNLMRARAERLDTEARQAWSEYHAALKELGNVPQDDRRFRVLIADCPLLFVTTCNVNEKAWIAKAREALS